MVTSEQDNRINNHPIRSLLLLVFGASLFLPGCKHDVSMPAINALLDFHQIVEEEREQLACSGAQIFALGTAFSCVEATCVRLAHDRAEGKCSQNCERFYDCDGGIPCTGRAQFCLEPLVLDFEVSLCPGGTGYFCAGGCRCDCGCEL